MKDPEPDRATLAAFGAAVLMAGIAIVCVRLSNRELAPMWGAAVRFAVSSLVMFAIAAVGRLPLPRGRALTGAMVFGLITFGLSYGLFYVGAVHVPAGLASVIMAATPLLTFFLAIVHRDERFRWRGLAGAVLAIAGITAISTQARGGSLPPLSVLAILGAAVTAAESGIVIRKIPVPHPVTTNAVAMATGAAALLAFSLATGERTGFPAERSTWLALGYLALVGTPALFMLFVFVYRRWTASAASYQFVLFPIVAVVLAAWLLGEPITASLLVGARLVLAGVYVGALAPERRPARVPA